MPKNSNLSYICNPDQVQTIKQIEQGVFEILKKGERFSQTYVKLNNGGEDFYVRTRFRVIPQGRK